MLIPDLPCYLAPEEMLAAFFVRDKAMNGRFVVAVKTTKIVCLPSCAARPKPENIRFMASVEDAILAGFRPCKRCKPEDYKVNLQKSKPMGMISAFASCKPRKTFYFRFKYARQFKYKLYA